MRSRTSVLVLVSMVLGVAAVVAANDAMMMNIYCPAVRNRLEVHAVDGGETGTISRLMWHAETATNLGAPANAIRGVRYCDAHCKVNERDEYNVRMALAANTNLASTAAATTTTSSSLDSTFVADLPMSRASDKAVCWFTYQLDTADNRAIACDSDSAFSFGGPSSSSSSSSTNSYGSSSSSSSNVNVGGSSAHSAWMTSAAAISNEYALPTLAASEVCPAINLVHHVIACPDQPNCAHIVFEAQSSRVPVSAMNLLHVDLHYHIKNTPTNMHVRLSPASAAVRAQLGLGESPLIVVTDTPITVANADNADIVYSFTYAVDLVGRGRVDCDTELYTARILTPAASSQPLLQRGSASAVTYGGAMSGVDEVEMEGMDSDYAWMYSGVDQQTQAPLSSVKQTMTTQAIYENAQPVKSTQAIQQKEYAAIKSQAAPVQQQKEYMQIKSQPVQQVQQQVQQIQQQVPVQIKETPMQIKEVPVQAKEAVQYITKTALPVQQIQQQQQQQQTQVPTKGENVQQYVTYTSKTIMPVQLIQQQQQQEQLQTKENVPQYVTKTAMPVQQIQQQIPVQTKENVQYVTKNVMPVQQIQQQQQQVQTQVKENVPQYLTKNTVPVQVIQQQQTQVPIKENVPQYITKATPVQVIQQQNVPQYITKTAMPVQQIQQQQQQQVPIKENVPQYITKNAMPVQQIQTQQTQAQTSPVLQQGSPASAYWSASNYMNVNVPHQQQQNGPVNTMQQ